MYARTLWSIARYAHEVYSSTHQVKEPVNGKFRVFSRHKAYPYDFEFAMLH